MTDEERNAEATAQAGEASAGAAETPPPRAPGEPQLRAPDRPTATAPAGAEARVAELEAQVADSTRQLQRLAADFENFRRRAAAEKEELVRFAASRVLENFLPIVDNFERALNHSASAEAVALKQGIELIYRQVADFMVRQGVAQMEAEGQVFDPNLHEAIGQMETTAQPDNTVLYVVQKGYFLNGRVLRHAMVQVASNPQGREAEAARVEAAAAEAALAEPVQDERSETTQPTSESTGQSEGSPAAPAASTPEQDFTLEDLMAEAKAPEGSKEESHG